MTGERGGHSSPGFVCLLGLKQPAMYLPYSCEYTYTVTAIAYNNNTQLVSALLENLYTEMAHSTFYRQKCYIALL